MEIIINIPNTLKKIHRDSLGKTKKHTHNEIKVDPLQNNRYTQTMDEIRYFIQLKMKKR